MTSVFLLGRHVFLSVKIIISNDSYPRPLSVTATPPELWRSSACVLEFRFILGQKPLRGFSSSWQVTKPQDYQPHYQPEFLGVYSLPLFVAVHDTKTTETQYFLMFYIRCMYEYLHVLNVYLVCAEGQQKMMLDP